MTAWRLAVDLVFLALGVGVGWALHRRATPRLPAPTPRAPIAAPAAAPAPPRPPAPAPLPVAVLSPRPRPPPPLPAPRAPRPPPPVPPPPAPDETDHLAITPTFAPYDPDQEDEEDRPTTLQLPDLGEDGLAELYARTPARR